MLDVDAKLESRYLSNNYTTRNLSEDLIKLKTCLNILIFSWYWYTIHTHKTKVRVTQPHYWKPGVNSGAPEGLAGLAIAGLS